MKLVLAAFLAGVAVGVLLVHLVPAPKRGGVHLSNPWADSEVWRERP